MGLDTATPSVSRLSSFQFLSDRESRRLSFQRIRKCHHQLTRLTALRLIQGTYVTSKVTKARTTVNGHPAIKTSQKGKRAIAAVVNRTVATGVFAGRHRG